MVKAKFYETPDGWLTMEVRGHAGRGKKGKDLLCAAISGLVFTMALTATDLERSGVLDAPVRCHLEAGDAEVAVKPKAEFHMATMLPFWTVEEGLAGLAKVCPKNMEVTQALQVEGGGEE